MLKINEKDIYSMVKESVKQILKEVYSVSDIDEHKDVVDNFDSIKDIIKSQWESPDDVWYINIDQRKKDRRYIGTYGRNEMNLKYGKLIGELGYGYVSGATVDDAIKSLENPTIYLYPEAANAFGKNIVNGDGGMNAVQQICNFFFARAYILIHKRSFKQTSREANTSDIHNDEFRRVVHISTINKKQHQWTLIDCDADSPEIQKELEDLMARNGVKYVKKMESHNGMHYILDSYDAKKLDFSEFNKKYDPILGIKNSDNTVRAKRDSSMLLYSPCGSKMI